MVSEKEKSNIVSDPNVHLEIHNKISILSPIYGNYLGLSTFI